MLVKISNLLFLGLACTDVFASYIDRSLLDRRTEAKRADGTQLYSRAFSNSRWSWYYTETGSQGSCGSFLHDNEYIVAMNSAQMNPGLCGKSITLSWRGKTTGAVIRDTCPGCPHGGLDLSPSLFSFFGDRDALGIIPDGSWSFNDDAPPPPSPPPLPPRPPPPPPPPPPAQPPKADPPPQLPVSTTSTPSATPSTTSSTALSHSSTVTSTPSLTSSSSTSTISYSDGATSGLAVPAGTIDRIPGEIANLADLYAAFIQMGGLAMAGHNV